MKYEFDKNDAYRFAAFTGISTREIGNELHFVKCPFCHGGSHNDKDTFSINLSTGQYMCQRSSCGETGNMITLEQQFNGFELTRSEEVSTQKRAKKQTIEKKPEEVKQYAKPDNAHMETTQEAIKYCNSRAINKETCCKYELTTDKNLNLIFPFRDETGEKVYLKYRNINPNKPEGTPKETSMKDGKLILFGMYQCKSDNRTLIITEGQIDALSVSTCGIDNAVSVPNGCKCFTWVNNCRNWMEKNFDKFIVFGDYQNGEITLINKIAEEFPSKEIFHVSIENYKDCKDANELLQKYGQEHIKKCISEIVRFNLPVCQIMDSLYKGLDFGNWIANQGGISYQTKDGEKVICSHPIFPLRKYINKETGLCKVELAYKIDGEWNTITVDKEIISSKQKIISLSNFDIRITSNNAAPLIQFLSDVEAGNSYKISKNISTSKLGWIENKFVPYDNSIQCDNKEGFKSIYEAIKEFGNYEEWLNMVKNIRQEGRKEVLLYMAASFASPLLQKINASPFVVSLCGKTGKGKTVALMLATSVWADPEEGKYFVASNATAVSLEVTLDFLNNLPLAVDDLSQIQNKYRGNFSDYIYLLCNGIGKGRGTKEGNSQRARTWRNIIITNSEKSLLNDTTNGGVINRIIEIQSGEGDYFKSASMVADTIRENYGYAGKHFIEILQSIKPEELKSMQKEFLKQLRAEQERTGIQKEDKQLIPMSVILTADKLATDCIFQDRNYLNVAECFSILKSKEEVDENIRAYNYILSEIDRNRNKFKDFANNSEVRGEIWGSIDGGNAYIINNVFSDLAINGNFDSKGFKKWGESKGIINNSSLVKKLDGKSRRGILLDMNCNLDNETNESIDKETTENDGFMDVASQEELPFE